VWQQAGFSGEWLGEQLDEELGELLDELLEQQEQEHLVGSHQQCLTSSPKQIHFELLVFSGAPGLC